MMKQLLNEWNRYINETKDEHKKVHVKTELIQKYDMGEGEGDNQLYSLLTSGAFTFEELENIKKELKDEKLENENILDNAIKERNTEVLFDESYPHYNENEDPLFPHAKAAGKIMLRSFIFHRKAELLLKNYRRVIKNFNKAIGELR